MLENPMDNKWTVRVEGREDCPHYSFQEYVLTSNPPIYEVVCNSCGRKLWKQQVPIKRNWPENDR